MAKTDTDVIVTQYRAEFKGVPFGSYSFWQFSGGMESRSRLERRRRATVAKQFDSTGSKTEQAAKKPDTNVGHIHPSMLLDPDAVVVFVPSSPGSRFGIAVLLEEVKRK